MKPLSMILLKYLESHEARTSLCTLKVALPQMMVILENRPVSRHLGLALVTVARLASQGEEALLKEYLLAMGFHLFLLAKGFHLFESLPLMLVVVQFIGFVCSL